MSKRAWIPLLFVAALACVASADEITVTPSQDAGIASPYPERNYGGSTDIAVYNDNNADWARRILVQFDISSLDSSTTQATGATLTLTTNWTEAGDNLLRLTLHRVLNPWVEGTGLGVTTGPGVTWNDRDRDNAAWSGVQDPPALKQGGQYLTNYMVPDVDYVSEALASVEMASVEGGIKIVFDLSSPAALAVIQDWIENPSENYGFVIRGTKVGTGSFNQVNFRTSEHGDAPSRPKLDITYDVTPEPATLGLLALSGLTLLRRRLG